MGKVIPISWLNQILLILSILCVLLSLVVQEWAGLTPLPIYVSLLWAIFIIIISVWLSCFLFQVALKANSPFNIKILNNWLYEKLEKCLNLNDTRKTNESIEKHRNKQIMNENLQCKQTSDEKRIIGKVDASAPKDISSKRKRSMEVNNLVKEINMKCINIWYKSISDDKSFPHEAQILLKKLLTKLFHEISLVDKMKLTHMLSNVFLLHFKEYHRALRRVEKGTAASIEEAFKYLHPGSRNVATLEHMLQRIVTVLAQEFLQWELTSSLPCKLLLSILAKRLLIFIETISSPSWMFQCLSDLLQPIPKIDPGGHRNNEQNVSQTKNIISSALGGGITFATAAVIPRPLPKQKIESPAEPTTDNKNTSISIDNKKSILRLDNLTVEHRGLWGQSMSEIDSELGEEKISPIYEEPTDLATTIASLRTVIQQKSSAKPLYGEEKSYLVYDANQFTNLLIPWTEFHTAPDGSQQLLYCIQFDDVEQRGVDLFETTTATVRRQYRDFSQLHATLKEIPELAPIMSNLVLPEGGRVELENYLKTLTTRLASECPSQLRHFLRPSSSVNKKADIVAPRFDKFLVKTVSGVFNSLKTVVPGFEMEQEEESVPLPTLMPLSDIPWRFVEDIKSKSLAADIQQLIVERNEYSSVDTAYEAVDSMEGTNDFTLLSHWLEIVKSSYEEEVDELDSHLMLTCVAVDLICELLTGIGSSNTLQQEAVVRWTKLLFGNVTEPTLQTAVLHIFDQWTKMSHFHNMPNKLSGESFTELKERLLQELQNKIPNDVKLIFGEDDTLHILKYLLASYEVKKINIDLNLQILDVLASQLLVSCKLNHNRRNLR